MQTKYATQTLSHQHNVLCLEGQYVNLIIMNDKDSYSDQNEVLY